MPRILSGFLLCLTIAFSETAGAAVPDTATVSFHSYGLIRSGGDAPRSIVAKRWHIRYESVAGCLVTTEIIDNAKAHNDASETILQRRHGKDWKEHFEADVKAEAARQNLIRKRLDSSAEIKALRSRMKKTSDSPWYEFSFDEQTKHYHVEVKSWDQKRGDYRVEYVLSAGLNEWELRRTS